MEESAAKPTIAGRCKHRPLQIMCDVRSTRQGRIPLRWRSPPILYKGKYAFQHAEKKSDLYFPVNRALHFYVMLRQHRTIPALRLKHHSGSCGTASALPKCSIMSGCGTRIVLRGQKPLALCDRCPCFGSLFPPLAALTFAASSIICAFGLASAAPRSPYRHLELCGIALKFLLPSFQRRNKNPRKLIPPSKSSR